MLFLWVMLKWNDDVSNKKSAPRIGTVVFCPKVQTSFDLVLGESYSLVLVEQPVFPFSQDMDGPSTAMVYDQLTVIFPFERGAIARGKLHKTVIQPTVVLVHLGFAEPPETTVVFDYDVAMPIYVLVMDSGDTRGIQHLDHLHRDLIFASVFFS